MAVAVPQPTDLAARNSGTLSLDAFLSQPYIDESPAWELINSVAIQKTMPGVQHSRLQVRLAGLINLQCEGFEALPELRCTVGGRSLVPDIAVLRESAIPTDEAGIVSRRGIEFAPDWVIEILSPDQSSLQVTRKILHLLRQGTQMGWLIEPGEQVVLVFEPNCLPGEFTAEIVLPVIKGVELELTMEQMFGWLKVGRSESI